jgi:UDP-glucuronate decarboxylase
LTVRDLADRVLAVSGRPAEIVSRPLPPDDSVRRCPDIARVQGLLGLSPRVSLDAGLRLTLTALAAEIRPRCPESWAAPPRAAETPQAAPAVGR